MHGTPQTDRRCPPAPGEPRAYVPRSTAVAFVHKPALRKPAGHRLDGLRCQQLLPVHVVDTLHRDGAHAHIERASSAHTAAAKIYTQRVYCTDSRKIRGCLAAVSRCLALSRGCLAAVSRCLAADPQRETAVSRMSRAVSQL